MVHVVLLCNCHAADVLATTARKFIHAYTNGLGTYSQ
jgi:hypothetical protein